MRFSVHTTPVENTPWESAATQQVLHEIETLKMRVNIDPRHVLTYAPARAGLQHIELAIVSQWVRQPICNRAAADCAAHPRSAGVRTSTTSPLYPEQHRADVAGASNGS